MSANQFDAAQAQLSAQEAQAAQWNKQAQFWGGCCCFLGDNPAGRNPNCPIHGLSAQAGSQFQYDKSRGLYNQPFAQFTPISEDDTMDRNPTDRATALECLKLAVGHTERNDADEAIVGRAEAFYSFVTGQPTASVADAVVEAVKDAVKAK